MLGCHILSTTKRLFRFGNIWPFLPNSKPLYPSSTGLGFALSFTPAIAMVGRYFSERKALAYGIALSGSDIFTYLLLCFLVIHTLFSHPVFYSVIPRFSLFFLPDYCFPLFSSLFCCSSTLSSPLLFLPHSIPSNPISPHLQVLALGPSSWPLQSSCL